jgi:hypothetical protein
MSKNTNLSFLTDYITADITNGRIGINNASPTVAFDVSGATRISGALTLTGALSGTSATFTGLITAQSGITFNTTQTINTSGTIGFNSTQGLFIYTKTGSSYDFKMYNGVGSTFMQVPTGTQNVEFLGTAAFSSSVTATYASLSQAGSATAITQIARFANTTTSTANGSGVGFDFALNDATGAGKQTGQIASVWSDNSANNVADLAFYTRPSGAGISEKLRITGNGNVGIGTTTPDQLLCLRKTSAGAETIALALQNVGGTAGTAVSMVFCPHESSATPEPLAKISAIRMVAVNAPTDLAFYTYGIGGLTEKMRVISTGDLVVGGTTSPLSEAGRGCISINGSSNSILTYTVGGTLYGYLYHAGSGGAMYLNNSRNNGITYITSYTNGVYLATNGTSWTSNSDIRLKNIISPIYSAVDKLTTLNPVVFSWKSDETNKENIGLIAQDVKEVFPQVIDTNEDGFLGVRYVELVPVLVKAIQELKAEIETLKQK